MLYLEAYRKCWFSHDLCKRLPDGIYALVQGDGVSSCEVEPQTAGSLFLVPHFFCPNLGLSMDKHEQMLWLDSGEPLNYTLSIGVIFSENYLQSVIMILVHRGTTRIRNTLAQTQAHFSTWYGFVWHFLAQKKTHTFCSWQKLSINWMCQPSSLKRRTKRWPRTSWSSFVWIEQVSL